MVFIEKDLPIEKLNLLALKEGNSKRPVYQIHKWWARRLGSVFRALILAAFTQSEEPEAAFWDKFLRGFDLGGPIILDPFMGGGTTVIEALKLGCRVVGVDVNPVAWFITKKETDPVELRGLDEAFHRIEVKTKEKIKQCYRTVCPQGHEADSLYYFWVKKVPCRKCGGTIRLFPNYEILHRDSVATVFCPQCLDIFVGPRDAESHICPNCHTEFDPKQGVARGGRFQCPYCGEADTILDSVKRMGRPLELELFALEYFCPQCGRGYKRADDVDKALYHRAEHEFEQRKASLLFPHQEIPIQGRSDPRPVNHGYRYFWQMFNARQLLCLSTLLQEIAKEPDQNIKEFLLIAFSDALDANNMFCKYEVDYQKISLLFGLHAYHPIERPAENAVWGAFLGRGTFVKCYEKVKRAKEYCQRPFERAYGYGSRSRIYSGEKLECKPATDFEELAQKKKNLLLLCQDSRALALPSDSLHAVITDPPYFDNVMYAELSDFFYVWLRLLLKDTYPCFEPELPRRDVEIVQNPKLSTTVADFAGGLTAVFKECYRLLKSDGILVFTFHHRQPWAWQEMGRILLNSGFYVSAAPIVRSEGKSGFHSSEGNIKYDACIVCRKRPSHIQSAEWWDLKSLIRECSEHWVKRLLNSKMAVTQADVFAITMTKLLEVYTPHWPNVTSAGKEIDLSQAITDMYSLHMEISASLLKQQLNTLQGQEGFIFEPKAQWPKFSAKTPGSKSE